MGGASRCFLYRENALMRDDKLKIHLRRYGRTVVFLILMVFLFAGCDSSSPSNYSRGFIENGIGVNP
jgi:hypothetical protein